MMDLLAPYLLFYRFPDLVPVHIPFDDNFMFYRTTIMALVSPLFLASVASLTLAMTTIDATIKLLQQMKILPTSGTCSSCFSSSGSTRQRAFTTTFVAQLARRRLRPPAWRPFLNCAILLQGTMSSKLKNRPLIAESALSLMTNKSLSTR